MSQPDLFVVCKNCGSEVSPYVTECPYCGQRVRKRAPKLERSAEDDQPRAKKARRPKLSRLRANEIEGIAPDTRPTATIALIAASLIVTLVFAADELGIEDLGAVAAPVFDQPWRYLTAPSCTARAWGTRSWRSPRWACSDRWWRGASAPC
ncbi:MAG: zinc-ribbon domain-containing protein [Thermoleophilaceae bacterium]